MAAVLVGCKAEKKPVSPKLRPLKVGSDTTYPPFEFVEGRGAIGFDIDIAREISKRLGLRLEVVSTDFENLIPNLKAGKLDMVMSALVITEERRKEVDFSEPYVTSSQAIITYKGSGIEKQENLAGKTVAVEIDTSGELVAKEIPEIRKVDTYRNSEEALRDLKSRAVDAIIHDYLIFAHLLKDEPKLLIVDKIGAEEEYGIAFKKRSTLKKQVDEAISDIKKDGTYERIFEKWFGEQE
jgi:polar amino acid transport system substrate-binding protein